MDTDVFIVGGGPAGLAAAILAAEKGFSVTVADSARPPIDKACGEGLMPDAVAALGALGVEVGQAAATPFRGIRFRDATAPALKPRIIEAVFFHHSGLGVRRVVLHEVLVRRAVEVGVTLLWGSHVTEIDPGWAGEASATVICDCQAFRTRWIVGADGENSQVRRVLGQATRLSYEQVRYGHRQHFNISPWTDFVEVYWTKACQIVAAPMGSQEVCVSVTSRDPHLRLDAALGQAPELAECLGSAEALTRARGARVALRRLRSVWQGRCALLGDASGSVDPITGEGLGLAFRQAAALVAALVAGDLRRYQECHDDLSRVPRLTSRLLLAMDRYPAFRDRALRILEAEPHLFSLLLNTHVQAISLSDFGFWNAMRLGWRVVAIPRKVETA